MFLCIVLWAAHTYHRGTQHIRNAFIINSGEKQLLFFRQQACQMLFTDKELLNAKVKYKENEYCYLAW